jgi:GDPmannose 4,6-dehydratase
LEAKRDWGYAKEFVEGMWMMLQAPTADDYVLATGKEYSVREFLEHCLTYAKISWTKSGTGDSEVYKNAKGETIVAIDPRYKRPAEVDRLLGDASKAKKSLGWEPKTTLKELAEIMMDADLKKEGVSI